MLYRKKHILKFSKNKNAFSVFRTQKSKAIVELILHKDKLCVNDELVRLGYATQKPVRANA